MSPSRYVHMLPKQRDLMGFDEVRPGCCVDIFCRKNGKKL